MHYLSAKLCFWIAEKQGADTLITPSLWSQEIIDALLLGKYPDFREYFQNISSDESDPVTRFEEQKSNSLATAGFPNTITVLVSGKEAAERLGEYLSQQLRQEWEEIAKKVKESIKEKFIKTSQVEWEVIWKTIEPENQFSIISRHEFERWFTQNGAWEWRHLWDAQINNSWEPYWVAIPLGHPNTPVNITKPSEQSAFDLHWIDSQETIAQTRFTAPPPTEAEKTIYTSLNVGTWWGSIQVRLGQGVQAIKNTRVWQIPAAPGNRSTISGQYSAVHPRLNYIPKFQEGAGILAESMRLFWRVMAEVYPGLFNGSEQLNAIELTKRMAWAYGGVADSIGLSVHEKNEQISDEVKKELALEKTEPTTDYNPDFSC